MTDRPPMDPSSDEASEDQLALAREQGEALGRAVRKMTDEVAQTGGMKTVGDYEIGFAIEEAEGMYHMVDGELQWQAPQDENLHVEVVVRDAADGRFVPCLDVQATLVTADGDEVGTHTQPLLWHPMINHYGRNWTVPGDGTYSLRVHVEPPTFPRHDEINGRRFAEPADVEFTGISVETGQD